LIQIYVFNRIFYVSIYQR